MTQLKTNDHKHLPDADLCEDMRRDTNKNIKATGRTRTDDLRFTKPEDDSVSSCNINTYENTAPAIAYNPDTSHENTTIDNDLQSVIYAWDELPPAVQAGILAMVNASTKG